MKKIKKYSIIIIAISIAALIIIKLFSNKQQMESELKVMQQYSNVIPVEIITPKPIMAKKIITENGTLRSGAEISVMSETSGKVISVAGTVGQYVNAGQILVTVEKEIIESQFKLAKTNLDNAEKDLERFNNLAGGEAITLQQLETSKLNYQSALTNFTTLKKQLENTAIRSPVNGIIAKRSIEKGTYLMPSTEVFLIMEQNRMIFSVKVAQNIISQLSVGQSSEIILDAESSKSYSGSIKSIGVTADLSGRYEVEINLANQGSLLRSGMSGKASFENIVKNTEITIPRKCIVGSIEDASVFILQNDSVISKKIKAVALNETEVIITEGLKSEDKVILSGQINLANGSKVKVINQ